MHICGTLNGCKGKYEIAHNRNLLELWVFKPLVKPWLFFTIALSISSHCIYVVSKLWFQLLVTTLKNVARTEYACEFCGQLIGQYLKRWYFIWRSRNDSCKWDRVVRTGRIFSLTSLSIICIYECAAILRKGMAAVSHLRNFLYFFSFILYSNSWWKSLSDPTTFFPHWMQLKRMRNVHADREKSICFPFTHNVSVLSPLTLITTSSMKHQTKNNNSTAHNGLTTRL